jgi:pantoate--beta-alanine ligase
MSSRNARLTPEARAVAPLIHRVLEQAALRVQQGVAPAEVQQYALAALAQEPQFTPEYFEVADAQTLQPLTDYEAGRSVVLCVAAHLGGVRLIDNILV